MDTKLLNKYIRNRCTPEEVDAFFDWIGEPDQWSGQLLIKDFWDKIDPATDTDHELAGRRLDSIHHRINLSLSEQVASGRVRILPARKPVFAQWLSRVAVILIIPVITLLIYTHFFQSRSDTGESLVNEIISPSGSRVYLELPDGTKVWLNQGSKMIYPQRFAGKTRTVRLSGEGYFEIAHDPSRPFLVESEGISVRAVGTAFNVKAYGDDATFETMLKSGKVVIQRNTDGEKATVYEMEPGQHFVLNKTTNEYFLKSGNMDKYVSWKDGKLVFDGDRLSEVAERLSRWYNVNIVLKGKGLDELTYNATFGDESLSQVLEMMEIVIPVSYTMTERKKMGNGAFVKQEILIYRRK